MSSNTLVLGGNGFLPNIMGTNYDLAQKLKSLLHSQNMMSPGIAFLQ